MEFVIISYFDIESENFSEKSAPVWLPRALVRLTNFISPWSRHKKYCAVLMTKSKCFRKSESTFRFDEVAGEQSQPLFPQWVKWVASRTDLSVNKNNYLPVSGDAGNYRHLTRRLALIAIEVGIVQHLRLWDLKMFWISQILEIAFKAVKYSLETWTCSDIITQPHLTELPIDSFFLSQRITLNCDLDWCFCSLSPGLSRNEASSDDFKGF